MKAAKTTSAMATVRTRLRRPAVIIDSQSRQPRRNSCPASQVIVAGELTRRRPAARTSVRNVSSRLVAVFASLLAQLVERALGDQPAAGDDADAVGHALGDLENMRGHDDGAAGARRARVARS